MMPPEVLERAFPCGDSVWEWGEHFFEKGHHVFPDGVCSSCKQQFPTPWAPFKILLHDHEGQWGDDVERWQRRVDGMFGMEMLTRAAMKWATDRMAWGAFGAAT